MRWWLEEVVWVAVMMGFRRRLKIVAIVQADCLPIAIGFQVACSEG